MVNLTIDGRPVGAEAGTRVLDALRGAGIDLPTLCDHKDLTPYGSCRLCVVEVSRNGHTWVTNACEYPVEEGLVVQTQSERALATRKMMAELLLARTPSVPAIQRVAASLGVTEPRFSTDKPEEMCILCGQCVRACHEIAGKDVLGRARRSTDRRVTMAFDTYDPVCDDCNRCITYCPTGAITRLPGLSIGRRVYEAAHKWIQTRQRVQYGLLALFAFFFLTTSFKWWGDINLVNVFSRLDPLQAIGTLIADRKLILLFLPALLTIAATVAYGRVWCGWVCPLGTILHLFGPVGTRKMSPLYRQVKYMVLFVILLMAVFGSLAFMYFDPITIVVRGVADPIAVVQSFIQNPWHSWARTAVPLRVRLLTLISVLPLLIVLGLNLIEKRFWCRYLCPLGALIGLGSKFAWTRRRVNDVSCVTCGDCVRACPMGAISPATIKSDPAECVMCLNCAAPCPKTAISYGQKRLPRWHHEFDPGRRELIGSSATAAAGLVLFNIGVAKRQAPELLRPPGVAAREDQFLAECIRCGQCVQACPGHALHPEWIGTSWESFWTPALVPALGGCQYDCNRCGQVCPSGAIPNLSLADKRKEIIGTAVVDDQLCINCMICEQVCPTKAIDRATIRKAGRRRPLPRVAADKCNGCGLCQFNCPVQPSITVYAPGRTPKRTQNVELWNSESTFVSASVFADRSAAQRM